MLRKSSKALSRSSGSFPVADDSWNFTSFFTWPAKGSQVLREIKRVPVSGTMPQKVKQLPFRTDVCALLASAGRGACSWGAHTDGCLKWASQLAAVWAWNGPGDADSFLSQDGRAYYLKGRREPTKFAPTCCG